ncbi:MAG: V-type ATPase 116kDa subunit family protein [Polyangiales bacterium]
MSRIRILGPIDQLQSVLLCIQDVGLVHLIDAPETESLEPLTIPREGKRRMHMIHKVLEDTEAALTLLEGETLRAPRTRQEWTLPQAALVAGRARRHLEKLHDERKAREEERSLILKFQPFFAVFQRMEAGLDAHGIRVFYLVLREGGKSDLARLRAVLREALGDGFELLGQPSEAGEAAMLLAVPASSAREAEQLLSESGVQSLSLPDQFEERSVGATMLRMQERLSQLPGELAELENRRRQIASDRGGELLQIQAFIRDQLSTLEAMEKAVTTPRAFVLEGWIPAAALSDLERRISQSFGDSVEVDTMASSEWSGDPAPVVLKNPRLFRPFEAITSMMPLPSYGSVDPTPFVAILFPMFFGIMLGDIGYGVMLAAVSLILRFRSAPGSKVRSIAEIGGACALFSIIFGFLYGELFGNLGHYIGLHPIIFNREEAFFPFLGLAVALGVVHVVIGLLIGAVQEFRGDKRKAVGRGMAALMIVLIALALLAAADMLPHRFFTPLVIAVLVAFPILIIGEGVLAPIEFVSTLGNVLSYARIMAVGTASVMMAVVANRMIGAFGGVVVGVLFALLFHLINFVIGVFSPTIHLLRLHYVEFFQKFYSPGGSQYQPFRHWSARQTASAERSK